jgi:hypothetical protein
MSVYTGRVFVKFLLVLGLTCDDALQTLSKLSLDLQEHDMFLYTASKKKEKYC